MLATLRFVKVTRTAPLRCSKTVRAPRVIMRAIIIVQKLFGRIRLPLFSLDKLAWFVLRFGLGYYLLL